jgi:ribosome-binding protein aMBF1 (putative translation factor)
MRKAKTKTYLDKLLADARFKKLFEKEYQNLLISEQIARLRHEAGLTQEALAKKITTSKSVISRYESADYQNYTIGTLRKIAHACGAHLQILFTPGGRRHAAKRAG